MSEYICRVDHPEKQLTSRLTMLDIELTERCNNNCIHCCINLPEDDREAMQREMDTDQVKAILTEAAALGCLRVRFTGGEPLLRSDFDELYLFARRLGLKVLIFTNARLITSQLAGLFARIPPLEPLEVSVYGMHLESYEAVSRVKGSFAQFRSGLNLLLQYRVPFFVKAALLPQNKDELTEFETWAESIPWMTDRPGYAMFFEQRGRRDDPDKDRLIASLRVSTEEAVALLTRDQGKYCREMEDFASQFMGPQGSQLFACGAGNKLCVDAYGRAQPCLGLRLPELTIDLFENKTSARLAGALERYANLEKIRASNPDYLQRCAACFLKSLCGQCPAKSWSEHGTLDTPVEYLCQAAHLQARWLGWLEQGEQAWSVQNWPDRVKKAIDKSDDRY